MHQGTAAYGWIGTDGKGTAKYPFTLTVEVNDSGDQFTWDPQVQNESKPPPLETDLGSEGG